MTRVVPLLHLCDYSFTHPPRFCQDADAPDDDDDDDDDSENELKTLVDKLDPKLRQKVLMGAKQRAAVDEDDEDEDDKDAAATSKWGKKKAYWAGDTADLEIGQDVQDAEDEQEAAEVRRYFRALSLATSLHLCTRATPLTKFLALLC